MAAFDALIAGDLPPAGNPVVLRRSQGLPQFSGFHSIWLNSGTAALALALMLVRRTRPEVSDPAVILPGYGCPDLVTAAVFAGVRPVLVDVCRDAPGYDLNALAHALGPSSIAVVAVNFLGIGERLGEIRALIRAKMRTPVHLIEDNAQWFPENSAIDEPRGDLVCLSFGRGKPVSLLGGGALLVAEPLAELMKTLPIAEAVGPGSLFTWKVKAYNALLCPQLYYLLSRNPWLKLGQTRFKPLPAIRQMDRVRQDLLAENAGYYLRRSRVVEDTLRGLCVGSPWIERDLAVTSGERCGRLLRYPLLCADRLSRDALWARLRDAGLGATAMYQQTLPEIAGVAERVAVPAPLTGAKFFADRLLTLPVHDGVSVAHLERLRQLLKVLD